jgi:hypothetical protein
MGRNRSPRPSKKSATSQAQEPKGRKRVLKNAQKDFAAAEKEKKESAAIIEILVLEDA